MGERGYSFRVVTVSSAVSLDSEWCVCLFLVPARAEGKPLLMVELAGDILL